MYILFILYLNKPNSLISRLWSVQNKLPPGGLIELSQYLWSASSGMLPVMSAMNIETIEVSSKEFNVIAQLR